MLQICQTISKTYVLIMCIIQYSSYAKGLFKWAQNSYNCGKLYFSSCVEKLRFYEIKLLTFRVPFAQTIWWLFINIHWVGNMTSQQRQQSRIRVARKNHLIKIQKTNYELSWVRDGQKQSSRCVLWKKCF